MLKLNKSLKKQLKKYSSILKKSIEADFRKEGNEFFQNVFLSAEITHYYCNLYTDNADDSIINLLLQVLNSAIPVMAIIYDKLDDTTPEVSNITEHEKERFTFLFQRLLKLYKECYFVTINNSETVDETLTLAYWHLAQRGCFSVCSSLTNA